MNYLVAKKALRDTMSAEDYTKTIDFSNLIDFSPQPWPKDMFNELYFKFIPCDPMSVLESEIPTWGTTSKNLISTDLHLDMILLGYIPA
jgi:hypothetical protein